MSARRVESMNGGVSLQVAAGPNAEASSSLVARTTLVLPIALDENLEGYALKNGLAKGELIKRVLVEFLTKEGLQPDKRPKVSISY